MAPASEDGAGAISTDFPKGNANVNSSLKKVTALIPPTSNYLTILVSFDRFQREEKSPRRR